MRGDILFIGLWPADSPQHTEPERFAHLPGWAAGLGFSWRSAHYTALDPRCEAPAGIVLSGSRYNLGEDADLVQFAAVGALLDRLPRTPVLALCFGHQYLNLRAGGRLERQPAPRRTADHAVRLGRDPAFAGLPRVCPLVENHVQRVAAPGVGFRIVATSDDGIEACRHQWRPWLTVQFHPEYWPQQRPGQQWGRRVMESWATGLRA